MSTFNPVTGQTQTRVPANISSKNTFEVWVENLNEQNGEDFGWEIMHEDNLQIPVTSARVIRGGQSTTGNDKVESQQRFNAGNELLTDNTNTYFAVAPIWEHDVTVPDTVGETGRYRLVIAEYEEYLVDDDLPYEIVPEKKDCRLVFVEHIQLN